MPLAAWGALATAVAEEALTAGRRLATALAGHPDSEALAAIPW